MVKEPSSSNTFLGVFVPLGRASFGHLILILNLKKNWLVKLQISRVRKAVNQVPSIDCFALVFLFSPSFPLSLFPFIFDKSPVKSFPTLSNGSNNRPAEQCLHYKTRASSQMWWQNDNKCLTSWQSKEQPIKKNRNLNKFCYSENW